MKKYQKDAWVANKHIKGYSPPLIIREKQADHNDVPHTPVRMAQMKQDWPSMPRGQHEKGLPLTHCGEMHSITGTLDSGLGFLTKGNTHLWGEQPPHPWLFTPEKCTLIITRNPGYKQCLEQPQSLSSRTGNSDNALQPLTG